MYITNNKDLAEVVSHIRIAGTDTAEYEVKAASGGFPKSIPETIAAFANTHGGVIILGLSEEQEFAPVKNLDVKMLQASLAQAARELVEPPQAADIAVLQFENRPVVIANIKEATPREKPCFVKKYGLMNGSFIRTGDGDHKMSPYEIDRFFENQHKVANNDSLLVPDATLDDFDSKLLEGWLARVRETTLDRSGAISDKDLMINRRVASMENDTLRPTLAGIMALGTYPQKFYPRLNIVFTRYPGSSKGDIDNAGRRFIDSANIDGPIPSMVVNALRVVSQNMKHGAIIQGALREDVPDYPLPAVREAIANALMHRDYSPDGQGEPVTIDLYPDRLEIANPGGLFGSLTIEKLNNGGGTSSRNRFLARILEDVSYTDIDGTTGRVVENRGSGYPTITRELQKALMSKPLLTSSLDKFSITFRHRKMTEHENNKYSAENVEDALLAYFSQHESASTAEVARASGMSTKTARRYIGRLVEEGLIEPIGTKNSPKRRYRLSGN